MKYLVQYVTYFEMLCIWIIANKLNKDNELNKLK